MSAHHFHKILLLTLIIASAQGNSDPNDRPLGHQKDRGHPREVLGDPLTPSEFEEAEKLVLNQSAPDRSAMDPIEKAGLFEGDIVVDPEGDTLRIGERTAVTNPKKKWPQGIVPYVISAHFNKYERTRIARAMLEFERRTCIRFVPREQDTDYVMITSGNGCSSYIGRIGGGQEVTLGEGCVYTGIVMHELMHAIGFWHEQNRQDRDEHITIHYENIQRGAENNFQKVSWRDAQNLSAAYDTSSIMHYGPYAFSNSTAKKKTITPKVPNDKMGQREDFTNTDLYKINKLYECEVGDKNGTQSSEPGSTTSPPISSTTTISPSNCTDNHKDCKAWANSGECRKNPNWMLKNCKKSCNQCRSEPEPCVDNNQHCDYWAANGECSKNPGYMHQNCKKACNRC